MHVKNEIIVNVIWNNGIYLFKQIMIFCVLLLPLLNKIGMKMFRMKHNFIILYKWHLQEE